MIRKIIILAVGLMALCTVTVLAMTDSETISVNTKTLDTQTVERTVICDGVTEAGQLHPIWLKTGAVIKSVKAKEGMYIQQDEVLSVIDKELTKASGQLTRSELLCLSAMEDEVRASLSGILVKINASEGTWLPEETPVAVIAPSDKIQVRIAIKEKHLPQLKIGQAVTVSGDALGKPTYKGTLTEISSTAKRTEKGATYVEGVVEISGDYGKELRIGINVSCEIVVETVTDCVVVPYEAVRRDDNNVEYLYLLTDGQAVKHEMSNGGECPNGLLVQDIDLVGRQLIMCPDEVVVSKRRRFVSAEERE